MSTETQLGKIHVFSSEDSYNTNKNSIGVGDLALLPILDLIHPIGSIYWSTDSTSPATLFGGTWEQIKDTFILAAGSTYSAGSTGGEASHTLTVAETPAHTHTRGNMEITGFFGATVPNRHSNTASGAFSGGTKPAGYNNSEYNSGTVSSTTPIYGYNLNASNGWTGSTSSVGSGNSHNNMPPYLVAYCWKRVA